MANAAAGGGEHERQDVPDQEPRGPGRRQGVQRLPHPDDGLPLPFGGSPLVRQIGVGAPGFIFSRIFQNYSRT